MRYLVTIKPEMIRRVKTLLRNNGIRETARKTGISYYSVWCIKQGKYDNDRPLQSENFYAKRCPITGFLIDARATRYADEQD